jgi:hypothetical protein
MGVGSKSLITDPLDSNEIARVIAGRLLVTTQAGGGGGITADVNIEAVGGVLIGPTVPIDDGGGSITVDGTVAATQSGAWTVTVVEPVSVDDNGGSLTVDGTVAVSSVAGTVVVGDGGGSLTIDDGGGSITVDGAVTVSGTVSVTEPVSVDDNGGSLTVDGTVAATQSGLWTVTIPVPVIVTPNLFVGSPPSVIEGVYTCGVVRDDTLGTLPDPDGDMAIARTNSRGALWVAHDGTLTVSGTVSVTEPVSVDDNGGSLTVDGTVAVSSVGGTVTVTGTVAATQSGAWTVTVVEPVSVDDNGGSLTVDGTVAVSSVGGTVTVTTGFLVDSAAGATAAVFPAGAVRDDALTTLTPVDGDYVNLRTDSVGALWVRERGDIVNVIVLSGSTDGAPIQITATTLGTGITLHTASATAGVVDRVSLYASNVGGAGNITLTLATTDGGANSEVKYEVMSEQTIYLGIFTIEDSEILKAYASAANVIRIFGEAIRHTA